MGVKVYLIERKLKKDAKDRHLYLKFHPAIPNPKKPGSTTKWESLGLKIYPKARDPLTKQHNKETRNRADLLKQKRENELNKPEVYTEWEREQLRLNELGEKDFVAYFKELAFKRRKSNHDNWMSCLNYVIEFFGESFPFKGLNTIKVEAFKEYLLTTPTKRSNTKTLAHNSAVSYFNKFKAALNQAYQDGILQEDLARRVKGIPPQDVQREFLTIGELQRLYDTPCNYPILKQAALFSALTGLRFSDIQRLTWKDIRETEKGYSLRIIQKKTKTPQTLDISTQARELMGEKGESEAKVFEGLKYSAYHNKYLFQWLGAAGITKDITFHCFRHTFAVIQLSNGTDIYTVSKMLGHKDLKTTQVYAKIVDSLKREAADKMNFLKIKD